MAKVYTTNELIQILAEERRACINGERLCLTASPTGFSPVLDRFLKTDGIQKFTAYNNFKATVHHYQRQYQVSGIVWQTLMIGGRSLHFPRVDDQLIALASDLDILRAAKETVLSFWQAVTEGMDLYLSMQGGKFHQPIAIADGLRMMQRAEWATIYTQGREPTLEIILQLGWGQPEAAAYRRGFPESGSESIHAVQPGYMPLG
jgi:hypothetical protein